MALYHPTYSLFLAASMLAAITSSSALSATANTNKNNRHHNISPPAAAAAAMTNTKLIRCAVVGVGVLGTSLCRQILREWDDDDDNDNDSQPGVVVVGITKTVTHHDVIRERVFGGVGEATGDRFRLVAVEEDLDSTAAGHVDDEKFQNVVFCAPPSGSEDYPAAVKEAAEKYWAGPDAGGVFVFTSSGAVYVNIPLCITRLSSVFRPDCIRTCVLTECSSLMSPFLWCRTQVRFW